MDAAVLVPISYATQWPMLIRLSVEFFYVVTIEIARLLVMPVAGYRVLEAIPWSLWHSYG
jgi:hypothetical protein